MNPDLQRIADDYLGRLRACMRGASGDVAREAESEIRAHIEDALAARGEPTVAALLDVLDQLGPPEDYGRDLALYMMVDRGYREWSLPHMARSTLFWALSTVGGAVVVLLFGILFLLALGLAGLGAGLALSLFPFDPTLMVSRSGAVPWLLIVAGAVLLAGLTLLIRWFVGQYVRHAEPHVLGAGAADGGWARRTERRILAVAALGLVLTLSTGFVSGAYRFDGFWPRLPPDFGASPLALASGLGLGILLLAPVLGVWWSAWTER
jgi:hypothetical protein